MTIKAGHERLAQDYQNKYLVPGNWNQSTFVTSWLIYCKQKTMSEDSHEMPQSRSTVELQWLEQLWDYRKLFGTWVVRATAG